MFEMSEKREKINFLFLKQFIPSTSIYPVFISFFSQLPYYFSIIKEVKKESIHHYWWETGRKKTWIFFFFSLFLSSFQVMKKKHKYKIKRKGFKLCEGRFLCCSKQRWKRWLKREIIGSLVKSKNTTECWEDADDDHNDVVVYQINKH